MSHVYTPSLAYSQNYIAFQTGAKPQQADPGTSDQLDPPVAHQPVVFQVNTAMYL